MSAVQQRPQTATVRPVTSDAVDAASLRLPTWRLNLMRVGYFEMGVGLVVFKWPEMLNHASWGLKEGTVVTMLVAMSVLALLGLRYPQRMLPILLFEVGWKLIWLALVALPLWVDGHLTGATLAQTEKLLWFLIVIAVIPWRHVVRQFVLARGE